MSLAFFAKFATAYLVLLDASYALAKSSNCPLVHTFFYAWYGNPQTDGRWMHWNHEILQHWNPSIASSFPSGVFEPPEDAGTSFWPQRGLYSSSDPVVLNSQMAEIHGCGIDIAVISWWGRPGLSTSQDGQGVGTDHAVVPIMTAAEENGVAVAFLIEPYSGRSAESVKKDIEYLINTYSKSRALFRSSDLNRPLIYVYDSYHTPSYEWARLLKTDGDISIRNSEFDADVIGLVVEKDHLAQLWLGGFDGVFTYFSSETTYGSKWSNWKTIEEFCKKKSMQFIPCVGPGYSDVRLRPWNTMASKRRQRGRYYESGFRSLQDLQRPSAIAIISYNEWGEGTQIEPAVPHTSKAGKLESYEPDAPSFYINKTAELINRFCSAFPDDDAAKQEL